MSGPTEIATPASARLEIVVRSLLVRGNVPRAASELLGALAADVYGFMTAAAADAHAARAAYGRFAASLPGELAAFHWRCGLRTFVYFLARRELAREREQAARPTIDAAALPTPAREAPAPPSSSSDLALALRRRLAAEDRELLVLHVDRGLDWHELALTSLGEDAVGAQLAGEADRLARRFVALRRHIARASRRPP
jgi:hypothetical protein